MKLSELIYPNLSLDDIFISNRNLNSINSIVTRFGPSPTSINMHIGNLYVSAISKNIAEKSKGVFILRIEDTDKVREADNGIINIIKGLEHYNIVPDEGVFLTEDKIYQKGNYGSYIQSERLNIYKTFAKLLIDNGYAYPCFCTSEELEQVRLTQGDNTGYYKEFAKCRNLSLDEVKEKMNLPFVIRLKSFGDSKNSFKFKDHIKGEINIIENDKDIILIKSDGYPTYHFAHVVDDYLMKITHVIRGDEWLSTLPIHLQLFKYFGFGAPEYAHISPIMKIDEFGVKRKISKRKDLEANVEYYSKEGYPVEAVMEYLYNIANPSFENWKKTNPTLSYKDYVIKIYELNKSGALFDFAKLNFISTNIISKLSAEEIYFNVLNWSKKYNINFHELLIDEKDKSLKIFELNKNRKDIVKFSDIRNLYYYFYSDYFYFKTFDLSEYKDIAKAYLNAFNFDEDKNGWFAKVKDLSFKFGYAESKKVYDLNPEQYNGIISDFVTILRKIITKQEKSPDLYDIICILGKEEVIKRMNIR